MAEIKLTWKICPAPTGRYRGFEKRSWPMAYFKGPEELTAGIIYCEDEYAPWRVRENNYKELKVRIASYKDNEKSFAWRTLNRRAATLKEAKEMVANFFHLYPEHLPKSYQGE